MYKFPFSAVLKHRLFLEETLQKELGLLKRLLFDEKDKLVKYKTAINASSEELQNKQKQIISVAETLLYVRFIEQLSYQLELQKEKVLEVEKKLERKRIDLVDAMKNRKILEKLKEQGLSKYKEDTNRKEQCFMNEMASVRFTQKTQE